MAKQFNHLIESLSEYDGVDAIMSQLDMNIYIVGENCESIAMADEQEEMDEIMSQIDMKSLYEQDEKVDTDEAGIPEELLDQYQEEMSVIEDDVILQMKDEVDPEIEPELPPELIEEYEKAMGALLPKKSINRYEQAYDVFPRVFQKWQKSYRTTSLNEKVIMAYFNEASSKYKPSSQWSMYSMLKKTLIVKQNLDLKNYCRLRAFLKTNADGFPSKQSLVFTPEEIKTFIVKAPDVSYSAMKFILIFGDIGACRGGELTDLTIGNVKDDGNEIAVHIPWTKTKSRKDYIIAGEFAKIIREYVKLRPTNAKTDRLLMQYRKGKCVNQVIGKHSIAKVPKEIAAFLKLPEPNLYTGHSYRRTPTTIAADAGASMEDLKRLGPWKSIYVCERYIQNSKANKRKLSNLIGDAINLPSTSTASTSNSGKRQAFDETFYENVSAQSDTPKSLIVGAINLPSTSTASTSNSGKQPAFDENFYENVSAQSDTPKSVLSEIQNYGAGLMSSDAVKLISAGVKPLSETLKGFGVQTRRDKENVILDFGGECQNFTIINLN